MARQALGIAGLIDLLRRRGMIVDNEEFAEKILLDVGFHHLGFYWMPFEKNYSRRTDRSYEFTAGTRFEDVVALYSFDFNIRLLLQKFITCIETHFRALLTYEMSNRHIENPCWFVDGSVVGNGYIRNFDKIVYNNKFRQNPAIKKYHQKHPKAKYAPAWKTCEYLTLGSLISLYMALLDENDRVAVSKAFGINHPVIFENYLEVLRTLRNACAHCSVMFDLRLPVSIRKGPAQICEARDYTRLSGAIAVIKYLCGTSAISLESDVEREMHSLLMRYRKNVAVSHILANICGLVVE